MDKPNALVAFLLTLLLLNACSSASVDEYLPDQRLAYKKQREAADNLEVPPDLTSGEFDDALDVPAMGGSATYSEYVGERSQRRKIATSGDILPEVDDVTLVREGDRRWLEIDNIPRDVWPRVVAFWREQGILLTQRPGQGGGHAPPAHDLSRCHRAAGRTRARWRASDGA